MYLQSGLRSEPQTRGGAYSAVPVTLAGGEGARCPIPKNPPLLACSLEFQPFGPQELPPPKKMGSVSNQNCCEGFRFTEKVEKH